MKRNIGAAVICANSAASRVHAVNYTWCYKESGCSNGTSDKSLLLLLPENIFSMMYVQQKAIGALTESQLMLKRCNAGKINVHSFSS